MRLDHIIVAVEDLDRAMADFGRLGFTVFYGGEHAGGATHNGLICLADGSYIELIALTDPAATPASSPYMGTGRGFAGFALLTDDLTALAKKLARADLAFDGPNPGGRARHDGVMLRWESLFLAHSIAPFLINDVTPRSLRVSQDIDKLEHENGALGIVALEIATPQPALTAAQYTALLGAPEIVQHDGNERWRYELDGCALFLQEVTAADTAELGPAPIRCRIRTSDPTRSAVLDERYSHGAWFELV